MAIAGAGSNSDATESANKQPATSIASNAATQIKTVEDVKLNFQKWETNSRRYYSNTLATIQQLRDKQLAWLAKSTAITEANYQAQADQAFAVAEESNWRSQTGMDADSAQAQYEIDTKYTQQDSNL